MKIIFPDLESLNKIRSSSSYSGLIIANDVKLEYISARNISFSCYDKRYGTTHSIIYYGYKKFPLSWSCDCKWASLKNSFCKHIYAVFYRLNKDPNFLPLIEKVKVNLREFI